MGYSKTTKDAQTVQCKLKQDKSETLSINALLRIAQAIAALEAINNVTAISTEPVWCFSYAIIKI